MRAAFDRRKFLAEWGVSSLAWMTRGTSGLASLATAGDAGRLADSLEDPAFDAWVQSQMAQAHVVGLSLALIREGRLVRTAGYGWADIADQRPMRADTLMNIASVTKTVTCTAIMQLWEQKKFAFDDDVNAHLPFAARHPAYPDVPMTFRQLLTHTASIADGPAYVPSYACGDTPIVLGNWLCDYFRAGSAIYDAKRNFHDWRPGARYRYSNVAVGLLGHLIERLADMPYADYVVKNVFAPLGMSNSRFLLAGMERKVHATPYSYVPREKLATYGAGTSPSDAVLHPAWKGPVDASGGVIVPHCLYSWATPPDGLARTSATELASFLLAYMQGGVHRGGRVLQPQTVAQILSNQHVSFGERKPGVHVETDLQGLIWYREPELGAGLNWGHGGSDPGITTLMGFNPQHQTGVVVLANTSVVPKTVSRIAQRALWGAAVS